MTTSGSKIMQCWTLMFLTVCVFRRQSLRVLRDPTRAVKVSCILLSKRQYVLKYRAFFFETVPLMHSEKLIIVS